MAAPYQSWGGYPQAAQQEVQSLHSRQQRMQFAPGRHYLARGLGRSYGDSCLNDGGVLLATRGLDHYIRFDAEQGVLECEAGVSLAEILSLVLPQGWFLPVTPGTQYVTVGGAIANDVHGKNHHAAGSFGHHLLGFELLRSDGQVLDCSPQQHADWFAATVGGLGLTGLIRRARLQLRRVPGPWIVGEDLRFGSLAEFFQLSAESNARCEYTVAWIDCLSRQGRGRFSRGNHAPLELPPPRPRRAPAMPFTPPLSLVNGLSLRAFNALYWRWPPGAAPARQWHYEPFFYPLDAIAHWNRMYGPRGFLQYQCVLPPAAAQAGVAEMLRLIAASGQGSFLAVLKQLGERPAPGLLSFARAGTTLALDFPFHGAGTLALLEQLDAVTRAAGGAVYPAKDARMSGAAFRQYFPRWSEMQAFLDPAFSSSFWRRVQA